MGEKKNDKILNRTVSEWTHFNYYQYKILEFMSHESKNIYNCSIFHTQIFLQYSNSIFKELYQLVKRKEITNIVQFDARFFDIYNKYNQDYLLIRPFKKHNNDIIYNFIKEFIDGIILMNDNYYLFEKFIIKKLEKDKSLKFPKNCSEHVKNELFYDIVTKILRGIYNKHFIAVRKAILSKRKCHIDDKDFIEQVKENKHLFSKEPKIINYKKLLKDHKLFKNLDKKKGIKSNQNYIARIVYKYCTDPKIPSDLMCNIIVKSFQAYNSFFALRKKGIKANIPKFLDRDGKYILPYFARSRKEIQIGNTIYYRLTVGSYISNNFIDVVDDNRLICINDSKNYKLYVDKKHLIKIGNGDKISKKDNFIIDGYYIPKHSKHIIEGSYIYIRKPVGINNLKLIEICPQYDGYRFKTNYVHQIKKTKNKPIKDKRISIDLGMKNLMTIYDPVGEQFIVKGTNIISLNNFLNNEIDQAKKELAKNKKTKKNNTQLFLNNVQEEINYIDGKNNEFVPRRKTKNDPKNTKIKNELAYIDSHGVVNNINKQQKTSKKIRNILIYRKNKIEDIFNKIVAEICDKYKDCEMVIVGYNEGWKTCVNMGKTNNRNFYEIPYRKLLNKLRDKLEMNNQKLIIREESYTSKCDAMALEEVCYHKNYLGKRIKRGLFSSSTKVLMNADLVGAINIMRKWEKAEGIKRNKITGINLCNPKILKIHP